MMTTLRSTLLVTAALLCAACPGPSGKDGGTPTDAGTPDAGPPDSGIPGLYSATNAQDGGVDTFQVKSSTVIFGTRADAGSSLQVILTLFSSLPPDELCDISRDFNLGMFNSSLVGNRDADLGFAEFVMYPDAGVAFVPGAYVIPDAGVVSLAFHYAFFDDADPVVPSGFIPFGPATLRVNAIEGPTLELGKIYTGGRFAASIHEHFSDGGFFNLDVDAHGCEGQLLFPGGF